ncbi:hypothetical protein [Cobetia amphilecti]|uniref:Uncharacterized protein n=1 Tax=Cobetia amphilecti TaxID=1055104 RepID=A0AAP4WYG7_9GAMM|nr:hypothetical protein [Cobetia amphilecti]MDO6673417.1 hypothetical protein [Cobetia amphilecti]
MIQFTLTTTLKGGTSVSGDPIKVSADSAPAAGRQITKGQWPALDALSPNFPVTVTGVEEDDDGNTLVRLKEADSPDANDPDSYRYTPWK